MKILVSALEHSANVHLKSLLEHLDNDFTLSGIFDSSLGDPLIDMQEHAIMGFADVIKKIPFFLNLAKQMVELAGDADKVLLIDSSGFNLPLAKKIKKKYPNKEIIYYILPQAWAWKRKRVFNLAKNVDKLLSIIPFEKEYYPLNANIEYVGHPLLDSIKDYKESLNENIEKILFMPGSRKSEIQKLMPIFRQLSTLFKEKELLLAIPKHLEQNREIYGDISNFSTTDNAQKALVEADFAFICSGTATLEAAIIGTPFILTYKAKALDYFIGSRIIKLNYIGLANIFFEKMGKKPMHPEIIQDDLSVESLIKAYKKFKRDEFLENSKILSEYLQKGSAKRVAEVLES